MDIETMSATGVTLDGRKHTVSLEHVAKFASWPTPTVHDEGRGGLEKRASGETRHGSNLQDFAMLAGSWATPTSRDHKDGTYQPNVSENALPWSAGVASVWADAVWLPCRDGKARPTQSGLFPLADGIHGRVGRLRGYGNCIVPQVAQVFIEAYLDVTEGA